MVDDPDVVGQQGDLGEDVAGDQDGLAPFVAQRPDEVPHLGNADGVQAVDGLVQDQQLRVVHHRQGDGQPLFHAQGVLGVAFLVPVGQVHQLQRPFDIVGAFEAPEPGEDLQVFCAGQVGVEPRGLDEAADAGQDALLVPLQRPAEDGHCAGCGGGQPQEHLHGGGLARPVAPQEAVDAPLLHMEIQVGDADLLPIPFGQALGFDDTVAHKRYLLCLVATG